MLSYFHQFRHMAYLRHAVQGRSSVFLPICCPYGTNVVREILLVVIGILIALQELIDYLDDLEEIQEHIIQLTDNP
jgi:hypothetical protein